MLHGALKGLHALIQWKGGSLQCQAICLITPMAISFFWSLVRIRQNVVHWLKGSWTFRTPWMLKVASHSMPWWERAPTIMNKKPRSAIQKWSKGFQRPFPQCRNIGSDSKRVGAPRRPKGKKKYWKYFKMFAMNTSWTWHLQILCVAEPRHAKVLFPPSLLSSFRLGWWLCRGVAGGFLDKAEDPNVIGAVQKKSFPFHGLWDLTEVLSAWDSNEAWKDDWIKPGYGGYWSITNDFNIFVLQKNLWSFYHSNLNAAESQGNLLPGPQGSLKLCLTSSLVCLGVVRKSICRWLSTWFVWWPLARLNVLRSFNSRITRQSSERNRSKMLFLQIIFEACGSQALVKTS